jgi:hypothetical protein
MIEPTYQPLKPQSEAELPEHGRIAYRAFKRAARKLRAEHRKLGLPIIVWKNGRVVEEPA